MPFPGPRPAKAVCKQCQHARIVCMEGDVFFTPTCPRCKGQMEIKPLHNPLLSVMIKQLPPPLRRHLNLPYW